MDEQRPDPKPAYLLIFSFIISCWKAVGGYLEPVFDIDIKERNHALEMLSVVEYGAR